MARKEYLYNRQTSGVPGFSRREISILRLMCEEKTSKQIAYEMGLSKRTIETTRGKLQERTGSVSMVGLVKYSIKNQIYQL